MNLASERITIEQETNDNLGQRCKSALKVTHVVRALNRYTGLLHLPY